MNVERAMVADTTAMLKSILYTVALLFLSFGSISVYGEKHGPIVGLLSTKSPTYEGEYKTAESIRDMLLRMGAKKVVLIDYNVLVGRLGKSADAGSVEASLRKFLLKNKIDRILIPGNYYNISSPPFPPVNHRQLGTNAVVSIMDSGTNLKLLAICGGLHGVLHAQDVDIVRVQSIVDVDTAASHFVSAHPRAPGAPLHRVQVTSGKSKLSSIVQSVKGKNCDMSLYLPDAHNETIAKSDRNMKRLHDLGYTITAVADDGIIEALEDKNGNMLLQIHPEYLLINGDKKVGQHAEVDLSLQIAKSIVSDFLAVGK